MPKKQNIPDVQTAITNASQVLEHRLKEGKEIPRFSGKHETIVDYLKSWEFQNSKAAFQRRVIKQAMEHPQWDLADARGHSKATGKSFEYFDEDGAVPGGIQLKSRKEESKYASYLNALKKYLNTGDDTDLMKFKNKSFVDKDGKKVQPVTDKEVIDDLAIFGQIFSGDDIYIH